MNLVLTEPHHRPESGSRWTARVQLDFCRRQWKAETRGGFWDRVTPARRGSFEVRSGHIIWLWDSLNPAERRKRNPLILWDAPSQDRDLAHARGKAVLFDPREPLLKDRKLHWQVDRESTPTGALPLGLRECGVELCRRNLPASGYRDPPNCVEGKARAADKANAAGDRATGCGGFVGWYFDALQKAGHAIPPDRVKVTYRWTPPGKPTRTDTTEIYLTGPTFGHREVAQAIEKKRQAPIYIKCVPGESRRPRPGDVYILLRPDGNTRHEGVIVDASSDEWRTADGGQGASGWAVGFNRRKFDAATGTVSGGKEVGRVDGWIDIEALVGAAPA
jgi:hypothetical protein